MLFRPVTLEPEFGKSLWIENAGCVITCIAATVDSDLDELDDDRSIVSTDSLCTVITSSVLFVCVSADRV